VWQRYWQAHQSEFLMLGVALDVAGELTVRPVAQTNGVTFPVLLDRESSMARLLGFRVVPAGFFVAGDGIVRYRHVSDFDVRDPRDRQNLERFLAGETIEPVHEEARMAPDALELFAEGVKLFAERRVNTAVAIWRRALAIDPDNFVIRSQIWSVEHPEHFYPVVDRQWQAQQLLKEGYDKPLP
jgi:hypothetical protein